MTTESQVVSFLVVERLKDSTTSNFRLEVPDHEETTAALRRAGFEPLYEGLEAFWRREGHDKSVVRVLRVTAAGAHFIGDGPTGSVSGSGNTCYLPEKSYEHSIQALKDVGFIQCTQSGSWPTGNSAPVD